MDMIRLIHHFPRTLKEVFVGHNECFITINVLSSFMG